jgi:IS5 family transposase
MAVKQTGQMSFVEALVPAGLGRNERLERLTELVKWYRFEKLLAPLRVEAGPGRPGYKPLLLFKGLLLQSLYGLSDAELEEAVADRLSFRRFVGLSLEEQVPDHTTFCRFRNLLVDKALLERLFAELNRQLENAGLILRRGTMLDATLIETTSGRPRGEGEGKAAQDPDAAFTRRKGQPGFMYGYKAHVGVDQGSGLVRTVLTTPANVNDTTPADQLICGDEAAVLGDAAYHTHARARGLRQRGVKARLMLRPNKHHPKLSKWAARYNRGIARPRAAVETTFATWKRRMGLVAIRYVGLAKASAQVVLVAIAFNMRRWVTLSPA